MAFDNGEKILRFQLTAIPFGRGGKKLYVFARARDAVAATFCLAWIEAPAARQISTS